MPIVQVEDRFASFKIEVHHKYTIIRGDSGTRKTALCEYVYESQQYQPAVVCAKYSKIKAYTELVDYREGDLDTIEDYVVFIDESSNLLRRSDIGTILKESNNYFVIISRDNTFNFLPVAIEDMRIMSVSGRYAEAVPEFPTLNDTCSLNEVELNITEDSKSGFSS